ncbi:MAG: NADH-quinone oxidoreductase subunit L [Limisphaerales bacterium]
MTIVSILVLVPFLAGLLLFLFEFELPRRVVVVATILVVCAAAVALAMQTGPLDLTGLRWERLDGLMLAAEVGMGLYVLYVGARARNYLVLALMLAQAALMGFLEWSTGGRIEVTRQIYIDKLSVIMALINAIVGGGICLYALGYMREYHEDFHPDVPDRRPFFFALLFVFMGAMFGLVFANNLLWLFLFWEITTLCSYLLIGYTQTPEAKTNAMRALVMNLAGGLAFALAIICFYRNSGSVELQTMIASKHAVTLLPAALLCFAGITKSAQCPFSSWLLGAMVAPTPVSALLHSSTMVKAGVYLVLRMAPLVTGTTVGVLVATIGGLTFLVGSFGAIATQEAKRVLAYSTVANLGLVVLCGGIGTYAAVWAGILLIIFHAVAKCLLFLCVGVVEHKLHSRDIEDMSGLVVHMPRVAVMMLIGMAGMFLAPFGMLISKWAVLRAVVDTYPLLCFFIVFGGSATMFFWAKWMGKLIEMVEPAKRLVKEVSVDESVALYVLSLATFLACLLFPLISSRLIEPYVVSVYGQAAFLGAGNNVILAIMMAMLMLFPVSFAKHGRTVKMVDRYLGGANTAGPARFLGSAGETQVVTMHNYYLHALFNEAGLARWGVMASAALLVAMALVACL